VSYDEQPDGDLHGECAAEIHRLEAEIERLRAALLAHAAQRDHTEDVLGMVQSVELPEPDTHCYDTDEERDVWSHSPDQMRTYGDAREAAGYARGLEVASRRGA